MTDGNKPHRSFAKGEIRNGQKNNDAAAVARSLGGAGGDRSKTVRFCFPAATVALLAGCTTSWLSGRRIYHGEPLSKVIEDVQLYTPRQIDLDPALKAVRFSGSLGQLDSQQAEAWVRGLYNIYPVEIEENSHRMFIRCVSPGCPGVPP
jgi:hypothetical protein